MKILAFDTTNSTLSVALLEDEKILYQRHILEAGKQAEWLILEIEKALREHQIWYQDLDLIAATQGPGSFTGVRIGLTVARTLKIATKKPLILINSLEALAFKYRNQNQEIFAAIDAKMDEFFIASFRAKNGQLETIIESKLIKRDDIRNFLPKNPYILCGSAKNLIDESAPIADEIISAEIVGLLALQKFNSTDEVNEDALYLRAPKITERKK